MIYQDLEDKKVLVAGSSSGICQATAIMFGWQGGLIETRFHERFSSPEQRKAVAEQTPLGRNSTAEDVAKAVLFLASEAANFITGEYIAVNDGLYMRA